MVTALFVEHWIVTPVSKTETSQIIQAGYDLKPEACPKCGVVGARFYKRGALNTAYTYVAGGGQHCVIAVKVRPVQVPGMSGHLHAAVPDMADGFLVTKRCVKFIQRKTVRETRPSIARRVGFDEKTIRTIAKASR